MVGHASGRRGAGEDVRKKPRKRAFRRFGHQWVVLVEIADEEAVVAVVIADEEAGMAVVIVVVERETAVVVLEDCFDKGLPMAIRMCGPKRAKCIVRCFQRSGGSLSVMMSWISVRIWVPQMLTANLGDLEGEAEVARLETAVQDVAEHYRLGIYSDLQWI